MARDNAYSRLVGGLKILLPLIALALLSTLFLFSRTIDPAEAIPYADLDIEQLAREPRIFAPRYAGVTQDGTAVLVEAETARPDPVVPGLLSAEGLHTLLETPDGQRTDIVAQAAMIDNEAGRMELEGAVRILTPTGYEVLSERLNATLDQTFLESPGAITGTGPLGDFSAGRMVLEQQGESGTYVVVFNEGVNLIYQP